MTDAQQVFLNGQKYLANRRTMVLGVSPGNPHYYRLETLEKLFSLAKDNSDRVLVFLPDKLSEHNYKAIGSNNPEKSARGNVNRLRNKCKKVMKQMGCDAGKYTFVKWVEDVEPCPAFVEAFQTISDLYQRNEDFRRDVQEMTKSALTSIKKHRDNALDVSEPTDTEATAGMDIEEGVMFMLKELAFFDALPKIYAHCEEFVFVYHHPWPVVERYVCGSYDGIVKTSMGIAIVY